MKEIYRGDYVQLCPRARPHGDKAAFWWKVTAVHNHGIDCYYEASTRDERSGRQIIPPRLNVSFDMVIDCRPPNQPSAA